MSAFRRTTVSLAPILSLALATLLACSPGDSAPAGTEASIPEEGREELTLTAAQVAAAGIHTATAGPGRIRRTLRLAARVAANVDAQANVNPRSPGLVHRVHARLGQVVETGDPLCEIDSVSLGEAMSAYRRAWQTLQNSRESLARERELLERSVGVARTIYEREQDLVAREITNKRFLYDAEQALREAELRRDSRLLALDRQVREDQVAVEAARARLLILGLHEEDLRRLEEAFPEEHAGHYLMRAPRPGVVVTREVTEGEYVDSEDTLFEIQDLSTAWVLAAAYEQDLAGIHKGAEATIRMDAFPGEPFQGTVDYIDYRVDQDTRSAAVRIVVPNHGIESWAERFPLRPGMFGEVLLVLEDQEHEVVVPEAAVVHEGRQSYVFVAESPGRFVKRGVDIGVAGAGKVQVLAGVAGGEEVVVDGTFVLKSMSRKHEIGEEE